MRILLIQPPLQPTGEVVAPLGLCTLAAWLMRLGYNTRIADLDLETKAYSPHNSQSYLELFVRFVEDFQPNVVGFTSMYNNSLQAERLIRLTKQYDPNIITLAGGSHFGTLGACSLRRIPELDYVIEGEGELSLASLLEALNQKSPVNNVPRLCYRIEGNVIVNPPGPLIDLVDLPPMWKGLESCLNLNRYIDSAQQVKAHQPIYIEAGRGCPFACTFCATAPFWQRKFRVKPVQQLVNEIRLLYEQFGFDRFALVHDLLTVDRRFMAEFCDAMIAACLPVDWMANSRTDIRLNGILPKMKAAGCWKLFYGVESASARIQESINKHLNIEEVLSTVKELKDHGITAITSFVIGFPKESMSELSSTIALAARLKLLGVENVQLHRLRLWPPAPLSLSGLTAEFDIDSLRIEYPFIVIPEEDIKAIQADSEFFEGYFAPYSEAGTVSQLAQVEMFFHHAIALAPFTIYALATFMKGNLISSFYEVLKEFGYISRENLEWESSNLFMNWEVICPLLELWSLKQIFEDWQSDLVRGLLEYETCRIQFISGKQELIKTTLSLGREWTAFQTKIDVAKLLDSKDYELNLTPDLLSPSIIVLARKLNGSFAAYSVDKSLTQDLVRRNPTVISIFEG